MTISYPADSTAGRVLAALEPHGLRTEGDDQYRCKSSPFRPGSDSNGFTLKLVDNEHGAFHDHVSNEGGSLYQLAAQLNIPTTQHQPASSKRAYDSLVDYCGPRYLAAFQAAGWSERQIYQTRPAFAFRTTSGTRYRFADGDTPTYKPQRTGLAPCWYGLGRALHLRTEGAPLVLVNGESSVVTAQFEGVPAVCISGAGEGNIVTRLRKGLIDDLHQHYPSGRILVALDCDQAGRSAAQAVVPVLRSAGYDAQAVDLGGGGGFDVRDFCRLHQDESLDRLLALPALAVQGTERAESEPSSWPPPSELRDTDVTTFPLDSLPGWLARYVQAVATELELDAGAVAVQTLAALSAIFQGRYRIGVAPGASPWIEQLSLWALFIAEPGERKSAVLKAATWPLVAHQRTYNEYLQAAWKSACEQHDAETDGPPPPQPPLLALTLTDTTQESLALTMAEQHGRAAIFSAEGNSLLAVHLGGAYRSGAGDVSTLNAAYSGDTIDVSRKRERERLTIPESALAMGLCIQPGVLAAAKTDNLARASGFLARFLYCAPDSKLGSRTHDAPATDDALRAEYETQMSELLDNVFPVEYPPAPEPERCTLSLDKDAFLALKAYQQHVEPRLRNQSHVAVYRDWFAKAAGQAVRVAGLLALVDGRDCLSVRDIQNGIAIVEWSAPHMMRAYNITAGLDIPLAQRAVAWVARKGHPVITGRALQRGLTISASEVHEVLATLIDHGYVRERAGARRTTEYDVHPTLQAEVSDDSGQSVRSNKSPTIPDTNAENAPNDEISVRRSVRSNESPTIPDTNAENAPNDEISVRRSVRFDIAHQDGEYGEVSGRNGTITACASSVAPELAESPRNGAHPSEPPVQVACAGDVSTSSHSAAKYKAPLSAPSPRITHRTDTTPVHLTGHNATEDAAVIQSCMNPETGAPTGWQWNAARPHQLVREADGQRTAMDVDRARVIVDALACEHGWDTGRTQRAYELLRTEGSRENE